MKELRTAVIEAVYRRSFSMSVGITALVAGCILLVLPVSVIPSSTVFDDVFPGVSEWVWPLFYTVSGGLIVYGTVRRNHPVEAAGMVLYAFSVAFILYVVIVALGILNVFITFSVQAGIVAGATLRAIALMKGRS